MDKQDKKKFLLTYCLVLLISVLYIFIGHNLAMQNYQDFAGDDQSIVVKATVKEVLSQQSNDYPLNDFEDVVGEIITFTAEITSGTEKGTVVEAQQTLDYYTAVNLKVVESGDKVLLYTYPELQGNYPWQLSDYERFDTISVLLLLFLALLLLFGGTKGLNTIISLTLTCLSVFYVFVPAVLAGENVYLWSIVTCIYITFMTLFIVNGVNTKSFAAIFGCLGGVLLAGMLTLILDGMLELTGVVNDESVILLNIMPDNPLDLKALIFAAIIIGAVGAIMDVSISIAASLAELKEKLPEISMLELWKSGMTISKDIMGTMANTLILAYMGSCLTSVLLMVAYNSSLLDLFNREMIIVEMLQALVGSMGILLALPLTSLICAALYRGK